MAKYDGSELATGRGSGKEEPLNIEEIKFGRNQIPFMSMTFAPIERRLDMAVWRALFASSARQARQFVTHGMVKVNGQKMPYAGYLLNPGDMFQVDPERVLYATGAPKDLEQVRAGRSLRKKFRRMNRGIRAIRPKKPRTVMKVAQPSSNPAAPKQPLVRSSKSIEEVREQRRIDFRDIFNKVELVLQEKTAKIGVKRKQQLRALAKEIKVARAKINQKSEKELDEQLKSFNVQFAIAQKRVAPEEEAAMQKTSEPVERKLTEAEEKRLEEAIAEARENPIDETKPYATPWRPRPYMSAFAFIPRYLEVNHNICSAVYLRHPVARPGLAEVPSPFSSEIQQLAFNWYLRRR